MPRSPSAAAMRATFARLPQRSIEHQRRRPERDVSTKRRAHREPSQRLSRAARGPPMTSMASRAMDDMRPRRPSAGWATHVRAGPGRKRGTRLGSAARLLRSARSRSGTSRPSITASAALQIAACSRTASLTSSSVARSARTPTMSATQRSRSDGCLSVWKWASGPTSVPGPVTANASARLPGSKVKICPSGWCSSKALTSTAQPYQQVTGHLLGP